MSRCSTHSDRLSSSLLDPLLCVCPVGVELEQASLSSTLDELITELATTLALIIIRRDYSRTAWLRAFQ